MPFAPRPSELELDCRSHFSTREVHIAYGISMALVTYSKWLWRSQPVRQCPARVGTKNRQLYRILPQRGEHQIEGFCQLRITPLMKILWGDIYFIVRIGAIVLHFPTN